MKPVCLCLLFCTLAAGCATWGRKSDSETAQAIDPPETVLVTYHLKDGKEDQMRALLTRAWLQSLSGPRTGPESAQSDLDEAWEIAERGPMPLFLADIHLHRARLFGKLKLQSRSQKAKEAYPWESPQADLAEARRLIYKHGYLRRKEELEDAEQALLG